MFFETIKADRDKPTELLFGTDWWTDCDDVAALDILLKAHRYGLIDLKAIGVSSVMRYSAPSVKALCEQHGLGHIPIGLGTSAVRKGVFCLYQKKLAARCKTGFTNADCPEAYKLYRSVLASLEGKAVIVDVGFPTILMELLASGPDEYSDLNGIQVVESKVSEIVVMGGRDVPGLTGAAYAAHLSPRGRPSWDPMTAVFAVVGDAAKAGYRRVRGTAAVDSKTGKNSFVACDGGDHSFLVKEKEDLFYKRQIDEILLMK